MNNLEAALKVIDKCRASRRLIAYADIADILTAYHGKGLNLEGALATIQGSSHFTPFQKIELRRAFADLCDTASDIQPLSSDSDKVPPLSTKAGHGDRPDRSGEDADQELLKGIHTMATAILAEVREAARMRKFWLGHPWLLTGKEPVSETASNCEQDGLRECPFCGGEASFRGTTDFWVVCLSCGADVRMNSTQSGAVAAWNRRSGEGAWCPMWGIKDITPILNHLACIDRTLTNMSEHNALPQAKFQRLVLNYMKWTVADCSYGDRPSLIALFDQALDRLEAPDA